MLLGQGALYATEEVTEVADILGAGGVVFEHRRPRSVCRYIERLTQPGMTQAPRSRYCSPLRSVHRGNGANDEQNRQVR
jgi:hypothetical protein